jgi:hypothetical protein
MPKREISPEAAILPVFAAEMRTAEVLIPNVPVGEAVVVERRGVLDVVSGRRSSKPSVFKTFAVCGKEYLKEAVRAGSNREFQTLSGTFE